MGRKSETPFSTGDLAPGERLNEVHLSRRLAVSRTPGPGGYAAAPPGKDWWSTRRIKGYCVQAFPLSEIVDAYEVRALLEGLAARLAAERGLSNADRATMDAVLTEGDELLAGDAVPADKRAAYSRINMTFHQVLQRVAGSRLLKDVIRLCQQVPQTSARNIMTFDLEDVKRRHATHHLIYEAILCRKPRQAELLMREHVAGVKASIVKAYARQRLEPAVGLVGSFSPPHVNPDSSL